MNSKYKNIRDLCRGINEFKRGYQLRNNLVKDENGDLLADSHNILNRWKKYFSQLLNVHRPPLWSSGQSSWLQIRRPGFDSRHYQIFWWGGKKRKKSSGSGTGSTQPREYN
jgi:hypothetical protein